MAAAIPPRNTIAGCPGARPVKSALPAQAEFDSMVLMGGLIISRADPADRRRHEVTGPGERGKVNVTISRHPANGAVHYLTTMTRPLPLHTGQVMSLWGSGTQTLPVVVVTRVVCSLNFSWEIISLYS